MRKIKQNIFFRDCIMNTQIEFDDLLNVATQQCQIECAKNDLRKIVEMIEALTNLVDYKKEIPSLVFQLLQTKNRIEKKLTIMEQRLDEYILK